MQKIKKFGKDVLDILISSFIPNVSIMAGCGMIKVIAVLLEFLGILDASSSTYLILSMIGDSIYYFLPFFVAINAAKKLEVDVLMAVALAAIALHPTLLTLGEINSTVSFFYLPIKVIDYSSQALPIIFAVCLLKYVEPLADKLSPEMIKGFCKPMLTLLMVVPVLLMILGPAATLLGEGFSLLLTFMVEWGWLSVGINGLLYPILIITGTANVTMPLVMQSFATYGSDPIFFPSGMGYSMAQAGTTAAIFLKSKNKELKSLSLSACTSALLGVPEPALYGVTLKIKRSFIAVLISSFLGGCYIGWVGLRAPTFIAPSLLTAPLFIPEGVHFLLGLTCMPVCFILSFIVAYVIGFDEPVESEAKVG